MKARNKKEIEMTHATLRKSSWPIILGIALSIFLVSCNKDKNTSLRPPTMNPATTTTTNLAKVNTDSIDCFAFNYPLTVNIPDSVGVTVNNDSALYALFDHFDIDEDFDCYDDDIMDFPVTATLEDGTTVSLNDNDDLFELIESCFCPHDDDDDECFELNFPISVLLPNGSTVVTNDDDELEEAFDDWYDANGDSLDPEIVFPITVTMEDDGSVVTINDIDEFEELEEDCGWDDEECFDFVYPITVLNPDGTSKVVNDYDELEEAFDDWFDNNGHSQEPTLQFPVSIVWDDDGTTEIINDEDELEDAYDDCDD